MTEHIKVRAFDDLVYFSEHGTWPETMEDDVCNLLKRNQTIVTAVMLGTDVCDSIRKRALAFL